MILEGPPLLWWLWRGYDTAPHHDTRTTHGWWRCRGGDRKLWLTLCHPNINDAFSSPPAVPWRARPSTPALVLPLNQNISAVTRLAVPGRGRGGEQSSTVVLFGCESESNSTVHAKIPTVHSALSSLETDVLVNPSLIIGIFWSAKAQECSLSLIFCNKLKKCRIMMSVKLFHRRTFSQCLAISLCTLLRMQSGLSPWIWPMHLRPIFWKLPKCIEPRPNAARWWGV